MPLPPPLFSNVWPQTVSLLHTFVMAMVLHSDVFRKLQAEMDSIVGKTRLPTIEDRPALAYLECVLKEMVRYDLVV